MPTNSFTVLATARLAAQTRVYSSSCCPDKDLVVLFSRLGGNDRMSLWNINQGTKKWETDIGDCDASFTAVAMAWSPDGQSIAVAREPPSIAVYSIQDGNPIHVLSVPQDGQSSSLCGVWWFSDEDGMKAGSNIPDIFKRNGIITGSALSILKILPLLDHLQEDDDNTLTATDLFAFQGSRNRSHTSPRLPDVIQKWPTLASDPISASIGTSSYSKSTMEKAELDAMDKLTSETILLAIDNQGHILPFLDGIYPLGTISVGKECGFRDFVKHPSKHTFMGQLYYGPESNTRTHLKPTILSMPLLSTRKARDLAKLSSTARELIWYLMRVVKEMGEAWYGSESQTGARELGPKWVRALEAKQKEFSAGDETDPILDLTSFLTTGRASEALTDFLGSGQDMSERGVNKWESTVTDALVKLRDFGEKRCATALQRLFLVLDEVLGWAKLPDFSVFQLPAKELRTARDLAGRGVIIASWLAVKARDELPCFREFIYWLRYEVTNIVLPNEANTARHDILEVNRYFMTGLTESSIDRWFTGPVPCFKLADLNIPDLSGTTLSQALSRASEAVKDCAKIPLCSTVRENDISDLDRNLDALIGELAEVCQRIFSHAGGATARSAVVSSFSPELKRIEEEARFETPAFPFRERTTLNKDGEWEQHLIVHLPFEDSKGRILLARLRVSLEAIDLPPEIGVGILECYLPEEEGEIKALNAEFFDDESVVIVYRLEGEERYIGVVKYGGVGYGRVGYVKSCTREDLMQHCMEMWRDGAIESTRRGVERRRGVGKRAVSLALNGRRGRRIGCVLDETGTELTTIDFEEECMP